MYAVVKEGTFYSEIVATFLNTHCLASMGYYPSFHVTIMQAILTLLVGIRTFAG